MGEIRKRYSSTALFTEIPVLKFRSPEERCHDCCGEYLQVKKTRKCNVVTLGIGKFIANETILHCRKCKKIFPSSELRNLTPDRCQFGFDIIEYVGRAAFHEHLRNADIVNNLGKKNIKISEREIAFLSKKFIGYLAQAHHESREQIKEAIEKRGGYILHVDGTCDKDSPHLFSAMDGISQFVLGNIKVPSEKSEELIPFFENIKQTYGNPLALVHDMSSAILKSTKQAFPGIPDYICHFHFLRDIGKDLFVEDNKMIKLCLKRKKIRSVLRLKIMTLRSQLGQDAEVLKALEENIKEGKISPTMISKTPALLAYALLHWAFDAASESNGYGFPFDREHFVFAQRLLEVKRLLGDIKNLYLDEASLFDQIKNNSPLVQLHTLLTKLLNNKHLSLAMIDMGQKIKVFDKLRESMQIADPNEKLGLNDDGDNYDPAIIKKNLTHFREWVKQDTFPYKKNLYTQMIKQLDQYWDKLLANPIYIKTSAGKKIIHPQRTNNNMERLFRDLRHGFRRKTGLSKMTNAFRTMLADTPLIRNIKNDEYLKIILDGSPTLADRFSKIEAHLVLEKLAESTTTEERLNRRVVKLTRSSNFCKKIKNLFTIDHNTLLSNN